MDSQKLNNKIEETLGSLDGAQRASPKPFLLTRINARLKDEAVAGVWGRALAFISRPLVAFSIMLLLIINVVFITQNNDQDTNDTASQNSVVSKYDMAINVSSIYDVEDQ